MYSAFDAVYCLSLKTSIERQQLMKEMSERLNIPMIFYLVDRMDNPLEGSWRSHYNIIQESYNKGYNRVLIFEDDAIESKEYDEKVLMDSLAFMDNNTSWDMFYLGWCPGSPIADSKYFYRCLNGEKVKHYDYVYKCTCFCMHAYTVSRKGMKTFLDVCKSFNSLQLDIHVLNTNLTVFMCVPMIFDQRWCLGNTKSQTPKLECSLSKFVNIATVSSNSLLYWRYIMFFGLILVLLMFILVSKKKKQYRK